MQEKILDTLYGYDKKNKLKEWMIRVENHETYSVIVTSYGQLNGKKTEAKVAVRSGKNIGKKNETTHYEQAILDAQSKWTKKKDIEKYSVNVEVEFAKLKLNENEEHLPMLAQDYTKHQDKVQKLLKESKIMIQPKLDGYRAVYDTTTKKLTTRQGKAYSILKEHDKLREELSKLPKGLILDGELYTHNLSFEELGVLRKTSKLTDNDKVNLLKIQYHIYDLVDQKLSFEQRNNNIKQLFTIPRESLVYVPTILVRTQEEIKANHILYIKQGYEGTMVRNKDSFYRKKYRSNDLLKYKDFMDDEFKITSYSFEKDTSANDNNLIVWIVAVPKSNESNEFIAVKVRPMGTKEERKQLYKECIEDFSQFEGRNLWTKFFSYTAEGALRFPTTKTNTYKSYIRDVIV
jgi:DNA ligase-1